MLFVKIKFSRKFPNLQYQKGECPHCNKSKSEQWPLKLKEDAYRQSLEDSNIVQMGFSRKPVVCFIGDTF